MEKIIHINTLDHGYLQVKISNPKMVNIEYLKDEVEMLTNIIGPHQIYYYCGKEVKNLESEDWGIDKPLEMIEDNSIPVKRLLVKFRSRIYPIYVSHFEKKYLLCLKLTIEKKFLNLGIECPFDAQILKFGNKEIPGSCALSDLPYNTKIDLELNSFIKQKVDILTYDLNQIEDFHPEEKNILINRAGKVEVKIDSRAPKWRRVFNGLSIECYCRNRRCEATNRTVVVNLKFGIFSIESLKKKILCPLCEEICHEVVCVGIYFAILKYKGFIGESFITNEEKIWNRYYIWRGLFDDWKDLKFSVRPSA
jgi:hypothetical protein